MGPKARTARRPPRHDGQRLDEVFQPGEDNVLGRIRADFLTGRVAAAVAAADRLQRRDRSQLCLEGIMNCWSAEGPRRVSLERAVRRYAETRPASVWPALLLACLLSDEKALAAALPLGRTGTGLGWMRFVRGNLLLREFEDLSGAERDFQAAAKSAPHLWKARAYLAEIALCRGARTKAFRLFDGVVAGVREAEKPEALAWSGALHLWVGDYRGARSRLEAASLTLAPFSLGWLGAARFKLGQFKQAREDLDRALACESNDKESRVWRVELLLRCGDEAAARRDLKVLLGLGGERNWAYLLRALILCRRGDAARARADLARIHEEIRRRILKPENGRAVRPTRMGARILKIFAAARGLRRDDAYLRALWL